MRIRPVPSRTVHAAGFTLVELMITLVLIAVLVIVSARVYSKWSRKARASEVPAMIADMKLKQEAFYAETGSYSSSNATNSENLLFPAPLEGGETKTDSVAGRPPQWTELRLRSSGEPLYCGYVMVGGPRGSKPSDLEGGNSIGDELWSNSAPQTDWFYVVARCDWDKDGTDFSRYISRGDQSGLVKENEGQ